MNPRLPGAKTDIVFIHGHGVTMPVPRDVVLLAAAQYGLGKTNAWTYLCDPYFDKEQHERKPLNDRSMMLHAIKIGKFYVTGI